MNEPDVGHLEQLRRSEIQLLRPWFRPGDRVLEIGGGRGYQASILQDWGCDVISLDIASKPEDGPFFHPVSTYDGVNFPFSPNSFDVVFSSNVLEHVSDLPGLLSEIRRVLIPGGIGIHVMPSSGWRLWTSIVHYPYIASWVVGSRARQKYAWERQSLRGRISKRGIFHVISRTLLAGTHGEYPSAFAELYYFSRRRWCQVFRHAGFDVIKSAGNGLFYTGYTLLPHLEFETRHQLARFLGSACNYFITKPRTS